MAKGNPARQKMINMMYLVLTALLALNVSKEVLDSFFEVNMGLERTINNFSLKNNDTYSAFDDAVKNNPEKYQEVRDKAYKIKLESDNLNSFIQEMKYNLVKYADNKVVLGEEKDVLDEDRKPKEEFIIEDKEFSELSDLQKNQKISYLKAKSNRDASGSLFLDKKVQQKKQIAYQLSSKIKEFEATANNLADGNITLQNNIKEVCDVSQRTKRGGEKVDWEKYNFYDMPAVGALTILSKIQSDFKNIESSVIDYLKRALDENSLKFDAGAEAIAIPTEGNFIIRGDSFKSEVFITAKNSLNPDVYVGEYDSIPGEYDNDGDPIYKMRGVEGVDYDVVKVVNGKGMYAKKTISEGKKKWGGLIAMKTEQGTKFYPFGGEYLVAKVDPVTSPVWMNKLYIGVWNPIKVSIPGFSAGEITPQLIPGKKGEIRAVDKSKGLWEINPDFSAPKAEPIINMIVNDNGKRRNMGPNSFRVVNIGEKTPQIARQTGGLISVSKLKTSSKIIVKPADKDLPPNAVRYKVISYNVQPPKGLAIKNSGFKFHPDVITEIDRLRSGDRIIFSDIVVKQTKCSACKPEEVSTSMVFTIE